MKTVGVRSGAVRGEEKNWATRKYTTSRRDTIRDVTEDTTRERSSSLNMILHLHLYITLSFSQQGDRIARLKKRGRHLGTEVEGNHLKVSKC